MNIHTGEIANMGDVITQRQALEAEREQLENRVSSQLRRLAEVEQEILYKKSFTPIKRALTKHEKMKKRIDMYALCGCGSGKKFKWCCHKKKQ